MKAIIIILIFALLICLVNYCIDSVYYLYNRFCRYQIGRWESYEWQKAVKKRAIKWLKRTPVVKITDNNRYILLDFLTGKYRSNTIQSWQKASLLLGLLESGVDKEVMLTQIVAEKLLDPKGCWRTKPLAVDNGMLAYSLLKVVDNKEKVKPAMDETLNIIQKQRNKNGLISYTGGPDNPEIYVDALGLTCPFLFQYSWTYHDPELEYLAYTQIEYYHEHGLYPNTILPNHAFDSITKLPSGVFGWGRGTGWYLLSLMDSLPYVQDRDVKETLIQWIEEAAEDYKKYQRNDGGFGSTLQRMQTYDSSSTAVFAWFYMECYLLLNKEEYLMIAERCLDKLKKVTRINGSIDYCQGDTKDIGIFSQTYDIMPFAQGMALRAINLWKKETSNE